MPELPEVEVTRRKLAPLSRRPAHREGASPPARSYFFLTPPARLARELPGARRRRRSSGVGKYLLAELDDGRRLLLHLGMTGQLFAEHASSVRLLSAARARRARARRAARLRPGRSTRTCASSSTTAARRCSSATCASSGRCGCSRPGESDPRLDLLGVDALEATGDDLFAATRKRRVAIKSVLLAQDVIAGIGNIYADEALFLAELRPTARRGASSRGRVRRSSSRPSARCCCARSRPAARRSATTSCPTAATAPTRTSGACTRARASRARLRHARSGAS